MNTLTKRVWGAMGALRPLPAQLGVAQYGEPATKVEADVWIPVANCKLEPKADAMLHLVIADLGKGTDAMAGKNPKLRPAQGLAKVALAVSKYGRHFDPPGSSRFATSNEPQEPTHELRNSSAFEAGIRSTARPIAAGDAAESLCRISRRRAVSTKGHEMKRFVLVVVASILAASATVSCDKLKPPAPPLPLPKTEPAPPVPQVTAPKEQAPGASAVR